MNQKGIAAVAVSTDETGTIKLDQAQLDELEVKYSNIRSLTKWGILIVSVIAIISSLYHLYASLYMPNYQFHLSMHLLFMMTPIFFMYPVTSKLLSGKKGMDKIPVYDLLLAGLSAAVCLYWVYYYPEIVMRSGAETDIDRIIGGLGILLVLEATRRTVGIALSIIASIFLAYAYFGAYLPGILAHRGYSIERIISHIWFTDQGIFGVPLYVSAIFVIVFILFGSFLKYSGAGEFFINLAYALTGWRKGGPAKTSVLASGFFGMISGSSIANAVTVGSFTIPLMKKAGYRKEFAGAVEAASSTGGQIMPPVMGAAAFIMVEFLGISYDKIIISAIIPAIAFFTGVWIMAHLEAGRVGLKSVPKSELPDWKKLLVEKGYLSISVVLLLYLILVAKVSIPFAGVFSIISIMALSYVPDFVRLYRKGKIPVIAGLISAYGVAVAALYFVFGFTNLRMLDFFIVRFQFPMEAFFFGVVAVIIPVVAICHLKGYKLEGMDVGKYKLALEEGTKGSSGVALACATAGIISGIATLTGLGLKIAMLVSTISGGNVFIALLLTMLACLVLGMGLPTTATYIVLVTMAVPALAQMQLPYEGLLVGAVALLPVHMFVLYYGVLADVTPPVALAAYAASGIAKSNQFWTGIEAFKISLNKLMVPFAFVFSPSILLLGINWVDPVSVGWAVFDVGTMFLGILALHASVTRYWLTHMTRVEQVALFIAALCLIFPNVPGAIYGISALIVVYFLQKRRISAGQAGQPVAPLESVSGQKE
ncbi:MAG: DctM-like transporter [Methanocella sp. PtaU1.Bin125]|nr:MAG: DctM-like transporter [Methanocella sp. PtaU1.Bin125]